MNKFEQYSGWAKQFISKDIQVIIDEKCWDTSYLNCECSKISMVPNSLFMPLIDLVLYENEVGLSVETWVRISNRITKDKKYIIKNNNNYCGAFNENIEKNIDLTLLLEAIVAGNLVIEVNILFSKILSTCAYIKANNKVIKLKGPSSFPSIIGTKRFYLSYQGYSSSDNPLLFKKTAKKTTYRSL